ncbi:NAD-dependent epimerase/dehydratase family protein [Arthrobacter roseus]|uniref:NAD-dependent epimerase/dehydratase family protein n=1 Tax=Arthrobacter roseus TaxID=136274 RepID=UPI0019629FB1|nr:nucleoside-diphosphate-sugar epimerase [Arthrobacter roseus]
MKVLVTGASGMLGGAAAAQIIAAGHDIRTFQRRPSGVKGAEDVAGSITDAGAVATAVEGMDAVVHLAAKVSVAGRLHEFQRINVDGTLLLLDAARRAGVGKLLFISSPSVAHTGAPISGDGAEPATPDLARGNYAKTKAKAELAVLAADAPNFQTSALRPHIVWGPGDTQLVERVLARAAAGRLPLMDSGTALIDTTYIDNAASAIAAALERMSAIRGRALVVTNGEPRPIGELLAGICAAGGVPGPRLRLPGGVARIAGVVVEKTWERFGLKDEPPLTRFLAEQMSTAHWFDQRRTQELLDWKPSVSIDEGLRHLAAHYGR